MIAPGSTFLRDGHLFIVISDPSKNPDKLVLVALTTHEDYKDQTCLLDKGDHPFCRHLTCVSYDFLPDMIIGVDELEQKMQANVIAAKEPVSPEVLQRIRDGAAETDRIHNASWKELIHQGVID